MKEIYYATTNVGKFGEITKYITAHEPTIKILQCDQDFPEMQSYDQKAIAIDKANQAWNALKKPVMVDDSGVYFDHYHNFPGTMSKFVFHGIGFEGLLKLTEDDNRATKRIHLVYKDNDEECHVFEGICKGTIVRPKVFEAHPKLPYDDIFIPNGSTKTMAELKKSGGEEHFSFRLQALRKCLQWLKSCS